MGNSGEAVLRVGGMDKLNITPLFNPLFKFIGIFEAIFVFGLFLKRNCCFTLNDIGRTIYTNVGFVV